MNEAGYYGFMVMGDAMGPLYPTTPCARARPYPPTPRLQSYPPPCETEVQGVLRTD